MPGTTSAATSRNFISDQFNAASSAAIAVYRAVNWAIDQLDTALIWNLKTVLGTNAGSHKNDIVSRIQTSIRNQVIQAAHAGGVITEQLRPVAVDVTKSTADGVANAVNSCQNAKKSAKNALGCVVAGVTVASMIVVPEGGAVVDAAAQGLEHSAPAIVDAVEHLAPGAEQGVRDLAGDACSLIHSFAAGTLVLMADGSTKPIELIKVGDSVEAEDPLTGRLKAERVDATWDNNNPEGWVEIRAGPDDLNVTVEHPFWVPSRGWVSAGDLRPGDRLLSESGAQVLVTHVRHFSVLAHHYNLTVHELHTFFVGQSGLLVHNCGESAADAARIVLGEGMQDVKAAGRAMGAKWYQTWTKYLQHDVFDKDASLFRNAQWIKSQIAAGKTFYTIGRDLTRAEPSDFYTLELDILRKNGIEPIPIPRPSS